MNKNALVPYNRPPTDTKSQCQNLIGKGLSIPDLNDAVRKIETAGYYRFKAYLRPFRDVSIEGKPFVDGANFDDAWQLYEFDEKLRVLVFSYIQRIEVSVRSKLNLFISSAKNNSFWYMDSEIFGHGNINYSDTVGKIRRLFSSSQEEYAVYYRGKYFNQFSKFYSDMPPGWVAIELMSFGNLSSMMKCISDKEISELKLDKFSNKRLGVNNFRRLCNWIGIVHEVRNHCGHHGRLFNRNLKAPDAIKQILDRNIKLIKIHDANGNEIEDQLNRIYTALAVIQQIIRKLGYSAIGPEIVDLFNKYPVAVKVMPSMGFPSNWQTEQHFFK